MPRSSADFWTEDFIGRDECKEKEPEKEKEYDCNCESARALKRILSLLDDLNNTDLRLLEKVLDRIICERKGK